MNNFEFRGSTFVGGDWANGFGVQFSHSHDDGDAVEIARFTPKKHHEGPPGICHGGAIATLLDEAMTAAAANSIGLPAYTVQMDIAFRAPVMLGTEVTIIGRVISIEGRKAHLAAQVILPDEAIAAEAKGLFIRPKGFA